MTAKYTPRKRNQSMKRRLAKLEAVLCTATAIGGLLVVAGAELEKSQLAQHSHGAAHLALAIGYDAMQIGGGTVADVMLMWCIASALIAKTNPKEFVSMIPRNFIQEYKKVIFNPSTYQPSSAAL